MIISTKWEEVDKEKEEQLNGETIHLTILVFTVTLARHDHFTSYCLSTCDSP